MTDRRLRVSAVAPDDAAALAAWSSLTRAGVPATPFETVEWWRALVETDAIDGEPRLLVAREPAGGIVGLLGLEYGKTVGGLRVVTAPGAAWLAPDHVDVVGNPAHRAAVAEAVAAYLDDVRDWDLLHLESLRAGGSLARAVAARRGLTLPTEPVVLPYVDLTGGPDGLRWSRNLRQQVGRGRRAAERSGGRIDVAVEPDDVAERLAPLMRLHNERFGPASQVFATPARRAFHRLVARRLAEHRQARVFRLVVGPTEAALLYVFDVGDTSFYYAMGLDPAAGGSPGRTLLGQAVLAAADEGKREFDLLRGEHAFKLRFSSGARRNESVRSLRPTARSLRYVASAALRRGRHRAGRIVGARS